MSESARPFVRPIPESRRWVAATLAAVALAVLLGWLGPQAVRRIVGETALARAEAALRAPDLMFQSPARQQQVAEDLAAAQHWLPDNPRVALVGVRYHRTALAYLPDAPEDVQLGHLALALSLPRQAAQLRPADARTWGTWAHVGALAGAADPLVWQAFERAYALAPFDTHVRRLLKEGALVAWAGSRSPEAAAWLQRLYRDSTPEDRQRLARAAKEMGFALSDAGVGE